MITRALFVRLKAKTASEPTIERADVLASKLDVAASKLDVAAA
ncbi:MAG TPA: hypothetical protein VF413_03895 [Cellulomonas sp.]